MVAVRGSCIAHERNISTSQPDRERGSAAAKDFAQAREFAEPACSSRLHRRTLPFAFLCATTAIYVVRARFQLRAGH
jgi:hypothetical protein